MLTSDEGELFLTVINKEQGRDAVVNASGFERSGPADVMRLTGPSARATDGVRFGDTAVDEAGAWRPHHESQPHIIVDTLTVCNPLTYPAWTCAACGISVMHCTLFQHVHCRLVEFILAIDNRAAGTRALGRDADETRRSASLCFRNIGLQPSSRVLFAVRGSA
jgi:hypothetical protein